MKKYSLGIYEKALPPSLSWEEKLAFAKQVGYDFLEISIDETEEKLSRLEMGIKEIGDLYHLTYEIGLPIETMCLSGHRKYPLGSQDEETAKRSMEIMEKAISFARVLGIKIIQLAGYDVYYEKSSLSSQRQFKKRLRDCVELAAQAGIILAFETMETEFLNTVQKGMEYVHLLHSPYLQMYPDLGNITNAAKAYNKLVEDDLEQGRGHIVALHLKESLPGIFREVPYGRGHVDFEKGIQKAWELGVRRYVTEFWDVKSPTWKEEVISSFRMMNTLLERVSK